MTVVEGAGKRGELDAVWVLIGRDVWGGGIGPGRANGGAGALWDRREVGGCGALVGAGVSAAVRGGGAGHAARVVVDPERACSGERCERDKTGKRGGRHTEDVRQRRAGLETLSAGCDEKMSVGGEESRRRRDGLEGKLELVDVV